MDTNVILKALIDLCNHINDSSRNAINLNYSEKIDFENSLKSPAIMDQYFSQNTIFSIQDIMKYNDLYSSNVSSPENDSIMMLYEMMSLLFHQKFPISIDLASLLCCIVNILKCYDVSPKNRESILNISSYLFSVIYPMYVETGPNEVPFSGVIMIFEIIKQCNQLYIPREVFSFCARLIDQNSIIYSIREALLLLESNRIPTIVDLSCFYLILRKRISEIDIDSIRFLFLIGKFQNSDIWRSEIKLLCNCIYEKFKELMKQEKPTFFGNSNDKVYVPLIQPPKEDEIIAYYGGFATDNQNMMVIMNYKITKIFKELFTCLQNTNINIVTVFCTELSQIIFHDNNRDYLDFCVFEFFEFVRNCNIYEITLNIVDYIAKSKFFNILETIFSEESLSLYKSIYRTYFVIFVLSLNNCFILDRLLRSLSFNNDAIICETLSRMIYFANTSQYLLFLYPNLFDSILNIFLNRNVQKNETKIGCCYYFLYQILDDPVCISNILTNEETSKSLLACLFNDKYKEKSIYMIIKGFKYIRADNYSRTITFFQQIISQIEAENQVANLFQVFLSSISKIFRYNPAISKEFNISCSTACRIVHGIVDKDDMMSFLDFMMFFNLDLDDKYVLILSHKICQIGDPERFVHKLYGLLHGVQCSLFSPFYYPIINAHYLKVLLLVLSSNQNFIVTFLELLYTSVKSSRSLSEAIIKTKSDILLLSIIQNYEPHFNYSVDGFSFLINIPLSAYSSFIVPMLFETIRAFPGNNRLSQVLYNFGMMPILRDIYTKSLFYVILQAQQLPTPSYSIDVNPVFQIMGISASMFCEFSFSFWINLDPLLFSELLVNDVILFCVNDDSNNRLSISIKGNNLEVTHEESERRTKVALLTDVTSLKGWTHYVFSYVSKPSPSLSISRNKQSPVLSEFVPIIFKGNTSLSIGYINELVSSSSNNFSIFELANPSIYDKKLSVDEISILFHNREYSHPSLFLSTSEWKEPQIHKKISKKLQARGSQIPIIQSLTDSKIVEYLIHKVFDIPEFDHFLSSILEIVFIQYPEAVLSNNVISLLLENISKNTKYLTIEHYHQFFNIYISTKGKQNSMHFFRNFLMNIDLWIKSEEEVFRYVLVHLQKIAISYITENSEINIFSDTLRSFLSVVIKDDSILNHFSKKDLIQDEFLSLIIKYAIILGSNSDVDTLIGFCLDDTKNPKIYMIINIIEALIQLDRIEKLKSECLFYLLMKETILENAIDSICALSTIHKENFHSTSLYLVEYFGMIPDPEKYINGLTQKLDKYPNIHSVLFGLQWVSKKYNYPDDLAYPHNYTLNPSGDLWFLFPLLCVIDNNFSGQYLSLLIRTIVENPSKSSDDDLRDIFLIIELFCPDKMGHVFSIVVNLLEFSKIDYYTPLFIVFSSIFLHIYLGCDSNNYQGHSMALFSALNLSPPIIELALTPIRTFQELQFYSSKPFAPKFLRYDIELVNGVIKNTLLLETIFNNYFNSEKYADLQRLSACFLMKSDPQKRNDISFDIHHSDLLFEDKAIKEITKKKISMFNEMNERIFLRVYHSLEKLRNEIVEHMIKLRDLRKK